MCVCSLGRFVGRRERGGRSKSSVAVCVREREQQSDPLMS